MENRKKTDRDRKVDSSSLPSTSSKINKNENDQIEILNSENFKIVNDLLQQFGPYIVKENISNLNTLPENNSTSESMNTKCKLLINEMRSILDKREQKLSESLQDELLLKCKELPLGKSCQNFQAEVTNLFDLIQKNINIKTADNYQSVNQSANFSLIALYLILATNYSQNEPLLKVLLPKIIIFLQNVIKGNIISKSISHRNEVVTHEFWNHYQKICEIYQLLLKVLQPNLLNMFYTEILLKTAFSVLQKNNLSELQILCLELIVKFSDQDSNEENEILNLIFKEILSSNATQIKGYHFLQDETKISNFTYLVLLILESKYCFTEEKFTSQNLLQKLLEKELNAETNSETFLEFFLSKSVSDRNYFKEVFAKFMIDLISLLDKVEFPIVFLLINQLSIILNDENCDEKIKVLCMDYNGKIFLKIKLMSARLNEEKPSFMINLKNLMESGNIRELSKIQHLVLDFLKVNSSEDEIFLYAYFANLAFWVKEYYIELVTKIDKEGTSRKRSRTGQLINDTEPLLNEIHQFLKDFILYLESGNKSEEKRTVEAKNASNLSSFLNLYNFKGTCDNFLTIIRKGIDGKSIAEISKSLKAATLISESYPDIFAFEEIDEIFKRYAFDDSVTIRESALNFFVKYIAANPNKETTFCNYFVENLKRNDANVNSKTFEVLYKIHAKFTDPNFYLVLSQFWSEERNLNLILEIFEQKLFKNNKNPVENVVEIIKVASDGQIKDYFQKLFIEIFKKKHDRIIENHKNEMISTLFNKYLKDADNELPYWRTIYMISKAKSELLVDFTETILKMITFENLSRKDCLTQQYIIKVLKELIPHLNEINVSKFLEEVLRSFQISNLKSLKTLVSCLQKFSKPTSNQIIIKDLFDFFFNYIEGLSRENIHGNVQAKRKIILLTALYIKNSNLTDKKAIHEVLNNLMQIYERDDHLKLIIIKSLGLICVKYDEIFLMTNLQQIFVGILNGKNLYFLFEVLQIFRNYFKKLEKIDILTSSSNNKNKMLIKNQRIHELHDGSSGRSSQVVQTYLKYILDSVTCFKLNIRETVFEIIKSVDRRGLVNPVHIIPQLICLSADDRNEDVSKIAKSHLSNLNLRYSYYIISASMKGIKLSFNLIKGERKKAIARGIYYRGSAVNDFLYELFRSSEKYRKGFILKVLNQFEQAAKNDLDFLIYLADNLSAFSYKNIKDVYYVISCIQNHCVQYGSKTLQEFKKILSNNLLSKSNEKKKLLSNKDLRTKNLLTLKILPSKEVLDEYLIKFEIYCLLYQLKVHLFRKYDIKEANFKKYLPNLPNLYFTKGAAVPRADCPHFDPNDVIKFNINLKSTDQNETNANFEEYFLKEFRNFQRFLQEDEGDSE